MKRRKRLRRVSEKRLLLLGERIEMLEGLGWSSHGMMTVEPAAPPADAAPAPSGIHCGECGEMLMQRPPGPGGADALFAKLDEAADTETEPGEPS